MDDAPLAACLQCRQAVVILERQQSSALVTLCLLPLGVLPAIVHEVWRRSTRRLCCAACGSTSLVPPGSPAAREVLGPDHDKALHRVRMQAAVLLERARRRADDESRSVARIALASIAGVVLVFGSVVAWHAWTPGRPARWRADGPAGATASPDGAAAAPLARDAREPAAGGLAERVAITADTLARAGPSAEAEPVMRLGAGDEFVAGQRLGGWVALADAPVVAWVPEAATAPAVDPAPRRQDRAPPR